MEQTKILLADDHRIVIQGIKGALLEHKEFKVVGEAENGQEAVRLAASLEPDIIIMDISMPDLNGLNATIRIKADNPGIRIIIYSMHSDQEYVIDLFRAGISGYVLKEDPISDLILAINAVKSGGQYFSTMAPSILCKHIESLEKGEVEFDVFEDLSIREREIFQLLAEGKNVRQIGKILSISHKTVESHKYNMMTKLKLKTLADLIKLALRKKIIRL